MINYWFDQELQLHCIPVLYRGTSPQKRSCSSLSPSHRSANGSNAIVMIRSRIARSPFFSTLSITSSSIHALGMNCESGGNVSECEIDVGCDEPWD